VRLTTNPAPDDFTAWSPDGRVIAFLRVTSPTTADLIVIPALGGAEKTIATISPLPIPPSCQRDRQSDRQTRLDAGWKMARLWWVALTRRIARHLVDLG
jgi:Tol biopolymer transport system component